MQPSNAATAEPQNSAVLESKHGGARPNSGRKTARRVERKKPFYLFADQHPLTGGEVREAVDEFIKRRKP